MATAVQNININVPISDIRFLKSLSAKMGWTIMSKKNTVKAKTKAPSGCVGIDEFFDEQIQLLKDNYK
ncbi:MAG: hypothetical protein LBR84_10885 [Tannerella sp.]|jgi:hypothetical protein|nr:hypothetical protein [Tannerella sp.]